MKKTSTIFLKVITLLVGLLTLGLIIFWLPFSDAKYADAGLFENYFLDPAMWFIYIMSVPFFIALYQTFKLLDFIEKDQIFSILSVNALKIIKYCTIVVIGLILFGEITIMQMGGDEDKAGIIALGIYTIFILTAVTTFVAILQKLLQRAVDMKSENDLTV